MKRLAILVLLVLASTAFAEIEKFATPSGSGIAFQWWPKVNPPKGWHHDEGSSRHFAFNAMAPDGSTFSKAETVLYAQANYKPRSPDIKTLKAFVESDVARLKAEERDIIITREPDMQGKDGLVFKVVRFEPGKGGIAAWERIAYADDGEYFLTFAVSSHSRNGLESSSEAFKALIEGYTPGP
jgi:hypothetical protein